MTLKALSYLWRYFIIFYQKINLSIALLSKKKIGLRYISAIEADIRNILVFNERALNLIICSGDQHKI